MFDSESCIAENVENISLMSRDPYPHALVGEMSPFMPQPEKIVDAVQIERLLQGEKFNLVHATNGIESGHKNSTYAADD